MKPRRINKLQVKPQAFADLCRFSGRSTLELARELGVNPQSIRNWQEGSHRVPYAAFRLLRCLRAYDLPGSAWAGWQARGDALYSPAGQRFTPAELAWISLVFRQAEQFRVVLQQLRAARQALASTDRRMPDHSSACPAVAWTEPIVPGVPSAFDLSATPSPRPSMPSSAGVGRLQADPSAGLDRGKEETRSGVRGREPFPLPLCPAASGAFDIDIDVAVQTARQGGAAQRGCGAVAFCPCASPCPSKTLNAAAAAADLESWERSDAA